MKNVAKQHRLYAHPVSVTLQLIIAAFLAFSIITRFNGTLQSIRLYLFFFSIFLINEVFFTYFVKRQFPSKTIDSGSPQESLTLSSAVLLFNKKNFVHSICKNYLGVFLMQKSLIQKKEVQTFEFDEVQLINQAAIIAQKAGGKYITPYDLFASYLLLTEGQTKLLFNKKLKAEDLVEMGKWARLTFPQEEQLKKTRVIFDGAGIAESWVSGWTIETQKYTKDFTAETLSKNPKILGREKEFATLTQALLKKENPNVLLVGEDGVGKEHLVGVFAVSSFSARLDKRLNHKKVMEFMTGMFMAGASDKAQLETRLESFADELSHAKNVVLYIPQLQDILGATSFGVDISEALLPYLKNGKMPLIATVTPGNYKKFVEENPIHEVFEVIQLSEPSMEFILPMLFETSDELEGQYRIAISYRGLSTALQLAPHYMPDSVLPGSAVTLLADCSNLVSGLPGKVLTEEDVTKKTEESKHIKVGAPADDEKKLLLNLEPELHKRVIGQDIAILAISDALRRIRSGMGSPNKPTSFLFLGPTGVGKTETAKTLASLYFGGETAMIRFDMSEYSSSESVVRLIGSTGEERGELTDKVHDNPFSLILLDEFEKAHPDILNLFLQILDDGRLTDGRGRTVSFINTFVIATSNAGSEFIREHISEIGDGKQFQKELLNQLQRLGIFKPELLNRFDSIVAFKPLDHAALIQVVGLALNQTKEKLQKQDIEVTFSQNIIETVIQKGTDVEFGARPIRRFIQDNIEDIIAKKLLDGSIVRGAHLTISSDSSGTISIS